MSSLSRSYQNYEWDLLPTAIDVPQSLLDARRYKKSCSAPLNKFEIQTEHQLEYVPLETTRMVHECMEIDRWRLEFLIYILPGSNQMYITRADALSVIDDFNSGNTFVRVQDNQAPNYQFDTASLMQNAVDIGRNNPISPTVVTAPNLSDDSDRDSIKLHGIVDLQKASRDSFSKLIGQNQSAYHCKLSGCIFPYKTFSSPEAVIEHIRAEDIPQRKTHMVWCRW
ncbi:hypothetical protein Clacol_008680 [Clathrus columnatus]|uniref:Uncharacterized protein n=1 Tax=Clathrus columnatus TaxID=1419009 RepID=A0AAV5AIE4_9AGAM|nr:hypothetical protein Clacol_008680 [Clathrus columnatus]